VTGPDEQPNGSDEPGRPDRPDEPSRADEPKQPAGSAERAESAGSAGRAESAGRRVGSAGSAGRRVESAGSAGSAESAGPAMNEPAEEPEPVGWLPRGAEALFGEGANAQEAYGLLTVDVPPDSWIPALEAARDTLGCTFLDWLSAVDEADAGFRVCAHVVALPSGTGGGAPRRLLLRTAVSREAPELPTATGVYAGAAWHERETHEMFGLGFRGHPHLVTLLLPDSFEGHPLRKDFVLAARVAKAWPGAKEPGESGHGGPKRRQMLPPGVPDPNEWGPLKGQLPPVPARPARGRAAGGGAGARGERPPRRARSAGAGSASQRGGAAAVGEDTAGDRAGDRASESAGGSAAGTTAPGATEPGAAPSTAGHGPRRSARTDGGDGSGEADPRARRGASGSAPHRPDRDEGAATGVRDADAPWHDAPPVAGEPTRPATSRDDGADEDGGPTRTSDGGPRGAAHSATNDDSSSNDSTSTSTNDDSTSSNDDSTTTSNDDAGSGGADSRRAGRESGEGTGGDA
jgi:NADH:ubiquinone oxidoreductase subunit C